MFFSQSYCNRFPHLCVLQSSSTGSVRQRPQSTTPTQQTASTTPSTKPQETTDTLVAVDPFGPTGVCVCVCVCVCAVCCVLCVMFVCSENSIY